MDFGGQFGGLLAMAFGMGCASGWGFSEKKAVAPLKAEMERRDADCDERLEAMAEQIKALEAKCDKLNEWFLNGMSRQLLQVKESAARQINGPVGDAITGGKE